MAGAEIIASAIGILCLIIFGYVLVGGILSTGENAASAQKEYILLKESQSRTAIEILHTDPDPRFINNGTVGVGHFRFRFNLTNIGSVPIGDFNQTDVYVSISDSAPERYTFDKSHIGFGGDAFFHTWSYLPISPDIVHPEMLDSGETMRIRIYNYSLTSAPIVFWVKVTTPNGVTDTYSE